MKALLTSLSMLYLLLSGFSSGPETVQEASVLHDTITTASGLKYFITRSGEGRKAEKLNIVKVKYVGRLVSGEVFDSSEISFVLGIGKVIKGWDEGISYLKTGDEATFIIPAGLAYGDEGSYGISPGATLIFEVALLDVKDGPSAFPVEGKKVEKTPEGLKYIVVEENINGRQAYNGKVVTVHYTGYFEDGSIFDSSIGSEPLSFQLGAPGIIAGWHIGIRLMKTGDKLRLLIPSKLAYKDKGHPAGIPPDTNLIFDVELIDVSE